MKKVLFVASITRHIIGFHLPYLKFFKERGYEVHVASKGEENILYCDKHYDINFERNPFKIENIKSYLELKKIIKKGNYEIIHCHTPTASVLTRIASKDARKKGTKVIYTAHGFHFYKGAPLKNWLVFYPVEKYLSKYTDALITINKEDYELALKKFSRKCNNIHYINGVGIDVNRFNFEFTENEKIELRKKLGLTENDFVLIFPARLDKNKNQIFLINVMEKLTKKYNNIHLLLPGRDELDKYYQNVTKTRGLDNNVHFLGQRDDIPQLLKISDLSVSSSLREGLPVNIMEAFACELPVVALNCRGMKDLIEENINGYAIDMRNKNSRNEFCQKIVYLMNNNEVADEIKKNNKQKSFNYSIEKILEQVKKIYIDI